jgi:hypothetical protein
MQAQSVLDTGAVTVTLLLRLLGGILNIVLEVVDHWHRSYFISPFSCLVVMLSAGASVPASCHVPFVQLIVMLSAGTSSYASHHAPCPPTPLPPFASCSTGAGCHITPVVVLPPPLVLSTRGLRLATCHCLFSTSPPGCLLFAGWLSCCILSLRLHLVSPFVPPPPHMSILDPPPSFAPAGCCVASYCAAFASRPLVNTAAS